MLQDILMMLGGAFGGFILGMGFMFSMLEDYWKNLTGFLDKRDKGIFEKMKANKDHKYRPNVFDFISHIYSTVTLLAKFLGLSTSQPRKTPQ